MALNTCQTEISKAITSNCTTQPEGQIEQRAWIFQRGNHSISYKSGTTNILEEIVNVATKKSYKILGVKTLLNAGMEEVIAADRATRFKHKFNFQQFEFAAADILNVDFLDDIFVVVERKDKPTDGDGTFVAYGVKNGLWKTSGTRMSNETNGVRIVEMASMDEGLEPHSEYTVMAVPGEGETVYSATLAMLIETEAVPT
jgi:hypothetical protein